MKSSLSIILSFFFSITLYTQVGQLDNTFGNGGMLITALGLVDVAPASANSVVAQPDGKIVFAGESGSTLVVARVHPNGTLDGTFGDDGRAVVDLAFDFNSIDDIALQADGKIVAFGSSIFYGGVAPTMWMMRFHADGTLDTNFTQNGFNYINVGVQFTSHRPEKILVQPDGKIVIAGSGRSGAWHGFVARFSDAGEPDITFGNNGWQLVDFGNIGNNFINDIVLLSAGSFIVGGTKISRLNSDGMLDGMFGNMGVAEVGFTVIDVSVQSDGKIIGVGGIDDETLVTRFFSDGTLDNNYGNSGSVNISAGLAKRRINSSALQSNDRLIIVGAISDPEETSFVPDNITLLRLTENGVLDTEFGDDGIVISDISPEETENLRTVLVMPDKKIVAAGFSGKQWGSDFAVLRYLSGLEVGTLDFSIDKNQLLIYPNPIEQKAILKYRLADNENISVLLFSMNGEMLHSFIENEKRKKGNHTELLVWPSNILQGNYVLAISNNSKKIGIKIVK